MKDFIKKLHKNFMEFCENVFSMPFYQPATFGPQAQYSQDE